jgi:octaprenyl-diphosphate synthase
LNITEEDYFNIIRKKTAALISACTACGARSVTKDETVLKKMTVFGENLGIAFQIKDDLFDYESTTIIGKPKANDIKEKKLTLPLISSLQNASKSDSKKILKIIRNFKKNKSSFKEIRQFVFDHKGVEYTRMKMTEFKNAAIKEIDEYKDSPLHKTLIYLIDYIVSRAK